VILTDSNEPQELLKAIQQTAPAQYANLNALHMSDYFFASPLGTYQFSRKQAGELLGNIDEAEDQLRDYYYNADKNYQVVEGIISPVPISNFQTDYLPDDGEPSLSIRNLSTGGLYGYRVEANGYGHGRQYKIMGSLFYAWIHRLAEAGIPTYFTLNWVETAKLLTTIYKNEQKENHTTLQRIIVPRITLKEGDNLVKMLVYLSSALHLGIGEKTAKSIGQHYGSIKDILNSDIKELTKCRDVGKITATRLLTALGKEVE
jgi:hypothetical protein